MAGQIRDLLDPKDLGGYLLAEGQTHSSVFFSLGHFVSNWKLPNQIIHIIL